MQSVVPIQNRIYGKRWGARGKELWRINRERLERLLAAGGGKLSILVSPLLLHLPHFPRLSDDDTVEPDKMLG